MKPVQFVTFLILVALFVACAPKSTESSKSAAVDTKSINVESIQDAAAWKAAYDAVLNTYGTLTTRINNGDQTAIKQAEELQKTAEALNGVAERIKGKLSGQELTDFLATVKYYREKFVAASTN